MVHKELAIEAIGTGIALAGIEGIKSLVQHVSKHEEVQRRAAEFVLSQFENRRAVYDHAMYLLRKDGVNVSSIDRRHLEASVVGGKLIQVGTADGKTVTFRIDENTMIGLLTLKCRKAAEFHFEPKRVDDVTKFDDFWKKEDEEIYAEFCAKLKAWNDLPEELAWQDLYALSHDPFRQFVSTWAAKFDSLAAPADPVTGTPAGPIRKLADSISSSPWAKPLPKGLRRLWSF